MPNVNHADLTGANLHEPKGVASAASGEMYIADGVGSGAWIKRILKLTASLSPASVAANTTAEESFTVTGALVASDVCAGVSKPSAQAGLGIVGWRVTADNTIAITFSNNTASPIVPTASETYSFVLYRT